MQISQHICQAFSIVVYNAWRKFQIAPKLKIFDDF